MAAPLNGADRPGAPLPEPWKRTARPGGASVSTRPRRTRGGARRRQRRAARPAFPRRWSASAGPRAAASDRPAGSGPGEPQRPARRPLLRSSGGGGSVCAHALGATASAASGLRQRDAAARGARRQHAARGAAAAAAAGRRGRYSRRRHRRLRRRGRWRRRRRRSRRPIPAGGGRGRGMRPDAADLPLIGLQLDVGAVADLRAPIPGTPLRTCAAASPGAPARAAARR